MAEPRDCQSEWSRSEKDNYMIPVKCGIKKKWTYLQNRNTVTDVENKLWLPMGKKMGGIKWEIENDIHTLLGIP